MSSSLTVVTEPGTLAFSVILFEPYIAVRLSISNIMLKVASIIRREKPVNSCSYFPGPYNSSSNLPLLFNPLNHQASFAN